MLHYLARMLEAVVEEVGVYTPTGIIEEFDKAVHEELDFLNEAANIRAFYKNHLDRPGMRIPKVYDELSARTVLTMEYINGPSCRTRTSTRKASRRWRRSSSKAPSSSCSKTGCSTATRTRGTCWCCRGRCWDSSTSAWWAASRARCRTR